MEILIETLHTHGSQVVISKCAASDADWDIGVKFFDTVDDHRIGNVLTSTNIIFGMRQFVSKRNSSDGFHTVIYVYIIHDLIYPVILIYTSLMNTIGKDHLDRAFEFSAGSIYETNTERSA